MKQTPICRYRSILVTGGSAVAGTGLRAITGDYTSSDFMFITSKDCDLTDLQATCRFVERLKPDAIVHLAAVSGGIGLSTRHPATLLRDNTLMALSILEAARRNSVQKTLMTLTTGMYPPEAPIPLKEEYIHDGYPHGSNYASSFAKRLIDPAIRAYREEFALPVIGVIPNGIFGENDNFNQDDATIHGADPDPPFLREPQQRL